MKAKEILIALAIVATVGIVSAKSTKTGASKSENKKECYVDANNNTVCDRHEDKTCTVGNGKGLKDGSGNGQGLHYRKGNMNVNGQGIHNGRKNGNRCGNATGVNFVDTNNNGVCDNNEIIK